MDSQQINVNDTVTDKDTVTDNDTVTDSDTGHLRCRKREKKNNYLFTSFKSSDRMKV